MNTRNYVQIDIPSGTDPKTLLAVAQIIQVANEQLRAVNFQPLRPSFHCDFDGSRRLTVLNPGDVARVVRQLCEARRWCEVTPIEKGSFELTVKNEPLPAHLSELFSPAVDLVADIERLLQQI